MKTEEKDLLLKDLCSRLPYGVKVLYQVGSQIHDRKFFDGKQYEELKHSSILDDWLKCHFKPYLFPLSSMTEEQYNSLRESGILDNCSRSYEYVNPHIYGISFIFKKFKTYSLELIEWLNKNHFDYRGLIDKGLAIDATGLNIY